MPHNADTDRQRIVFMGTPDFAVPTLVALAEHHDVVAVYAQPPRRQGRGMKERPSPVRIKADTLGIDVATPLKFDDDAIAALAALKPDILVVVAYGMILPQAVLDIPSKMPINGHASILPRWRGAAPIHRAIAAGDKETGVTAMKMEAGLDTGPMLKIEKISITPDDDTGMLHDRLAELTAKTLLATIANIDAITPIPQRHDDAIYADKITPDEAEMDFTLSTNELDAHLRAYRPFPGSWLALGRSEDGHIIRLKVKAITIHAAGKGTPGAVIGVGQNGGPLVATSDGAVELTHVQPQGKAAMSGLDFLNGNRMPNQISRAKDL